MYPRGITAQIRSRSSDRIEASIRSTRNTIPYVTEEEFVLAAKGLAEDLAEDIIPLGYILLLRQQSYQFTESRPRRKSREFPMNGTISFDGSILRFHYQGPMSGKVEYILATPEEIRTELENLIGQLAEIKLPEMNGDRPVTPEEVTHWMRGNSNHWVESGILDAAGRRISCVLTIPHYDDTPGYVEENKFSRVSNTLARGLLKTLPQLAPYSDHHALTLRKMYRVHGNVPLLPANTRILFTESIHGDIDFDRKELEVEFFGSVQTQEGLKVLLEGSARHKGVAPNLAERLFSRI